MLLHKIKMALIAYVSRAFSASVALRLARRFNMEKAALKDLLYGGLTELMNNKDFYYRSPNGADYSKWTERGNTAMLDYVICLTKQIQTAEENFLDKRAKDMVIRGLKGETL